MRQSPNAKKRGIGKLYKNTKTDDEYEDIFVYIPYTEEELCARAADVLRARRAAECFPVVNRGALWYDKLTAEQLAELSAWYESWLDAPATGEAPDEPAWLNDIK